jgi:GNAT superfamily N-acetyltransferase
MLATVTTTHLEMTSPAEHRRKTSEKTNLAISRVTLPLPELNRFFYTAVGGAWYWVDRLVWSYSDWLKYLDRPELATWIVFESGMPAGYFELERQSGNNVEIVYFGLLSPFAERGLGGWSLTQAVDQAWAMGADRVWVHTCNLDHPRALANYLARGFRVFKTETETEELPDNSPGPWPGSLIQPLPVKPPSAAPRPA